MEKEKKEMKVYRQWKGANDEPVSIDYLREDIRLHVLSDYALRFMLKRGYTTADDIYDALFLGLDSLHDTKLLKDAEKAVEIIQKAIENNEKIVLYSDYDSDGVHSAAVGVECLEKAGANADYYTNNRFTQGYGMMVSGVDEILEKHPDVKLIITADNGIMAFEGIDYAKSKGIKVVVTDHHEPSATLPNADAIVDPKRKDCDYPCKDLCGAGVVYKLMLLLYFKMGLDEEIVHNTLDLVATATVGDIVALRGENRILVREGLKILNDEPRLAYQTFIQLLSIDKIDSGTLGFQFVPTINAIGRLEGDPGPAIEMFLSKDKDTVQRIATKLVELNALRKKMTIEQTEIAENILYEKFKANGYKIPPVIIVASKDFHEGIIGLVAGRLKEKYNRPAFAFAPHGDIYKGSSRSIDGFHLKESFDFLLGLEKKVMVGGGGHAKAAGLSVKEEQLEDFEKAICNLSKEFLSDKDFIKKFDVDIPILANDISVDLVYEMDILQPFGEGFREPTILLKDFKGDYEYMGQEKTHVKIVSENVTIIMWNAKEEFEKVGRPTHFRGIGTPNLNVFNGKTTLQFFINDMNLKPY